MVTAKKHHDEVADTLLHHYVSRSFEDAMVTAAKEDDDQVDVLLQYVWGSFEDVMGAAAKEYDDQVEDGHGLQQTSANAGRLD